MATIICFVPFLCFVLSIICLLSARFRSRDFLPILCLYPSIFESWRLVHSLTFLIKCTNGSLIEHVPARLSLRCGPLDLVHTGSSPQKLCRSRAKAVSRQNGLLPLHGTIIMQKERLAQLLTHARSAQMGVVSDRTSAADYDDDMTRAKSMGIDAFALNIGTDTFTDQQLGFAYQSAARNGMKVFISFDFNWWTTSQAADVGAKIKHYGGNDAQLKVGPGGDQVFVSSFAGDGLNLDTVRSAAGMPLFIAPNFKASNAASADGALNWMAWPSNGANKAPAAGQNVTVEEGDQAYVSALGGKPYIARTSMSIALLSLY